ncbi:UDP-glucose 4-epimerase GalE [Rhizocola hellebori]|uniref:UDP-glucose 4-epimerase n=1 Tax=Rhizocola hellebori TaxID=1392758 RepID=A0A8J3VMA1_9ACTN|nr:NAD-dependent epimerase/dehydratase family protein [Rhizocola hellebori]GIH10991.1 UDP-glucose 4-epimerase GalE [Rhizocola hellebori]
MRVLVTGGLGFLGRAVTAELTEHGHEVLVLSHSAPPRLRGDVEVIRADLRDRSAIAEALAAQRLDGVCHLAGLKSVRDSFTDPVGYFDTNVGGMASLLRALTGGLPFVYASTSAVYGSARPGRLTEDLLPNAENPYAASKLAAEQLLAYTAATGSVGGVTLRCFNIAGAVGGHADPDPTRIIAACLRAAAGLIPHVTVNGDGSAVREFTHLADAARAFRLGLAAAKPGEHQLLNLGTGDGITMMEVVRAAERVTGRQIHVVHRDAANEAHTLISDPDRIQKTLQWHPETSTIERIISDAWEALHPTAH